MFVDLITLPLEYPVEIRSELKNTSKFSLQDVTSKCLQMTWSCKMKLLKCIRILLINVKIYHTLCLTYSSSLRCSINKEMLNYAKLRKHIVFSLALLYHTNGVATDTSHEHLLTDLDTCSSTSIFPRLPQIHHKSFSCRAFRLCLSKWHLTKSLTSLFLVTLDTWVIFLG